jgi:hypothetical protein
VAASEVVDLVKRFGELVHLRHADEWNATHDAAHKFAGAVDFHFGVEKLFPGHGRQL